MTHYSDMMIIDYFKQFSFMTTTLTVVGYGADMPDYSENINDTTLLMFMMLFGTFVFSKMAGGVRSIFATKTQLISI